MLASFYHIVFLNDTRHVPDRMQTQESIDREVPASIINIARSPLDPPSLQQGGGGWVGSKRTLPVPERAKQKLSRKDQSPNLPANLLH